MTLPSVNLLRRHPKLWPRSLEEDKQVLVAIQAIGQGEVLCVAPGENEEYEEWEMGPDGEMAKVDGTGAFPYNP